MWKVHVQRVQYRSFLLFSTVIILYLSNNFRPLPFIREMTLFMAREV